MEIIQDYISITKAKSDLLNLIRRIENTDDAFAITKNGTPEAVLISMKKFKGLLETIDILSDEQAMKSIRKSIREANQGKWVEFDKVFEQ
jgi:prevent-host-death family protein